MFDKTLKIFLNVKHEPRLRLYCHSSLLHKPSQSHALLLLCPSEPAILFSTANILTQTTSHQSYRALNTHKSHSRTTKIHTFITEKQDSKEKT